MRMQARVDLTVTLDRAAGLARLQKRQWALEIPLAELRDWATLYRRLWSRPAKDKGAAAQDLTRPGPWAAHYEYDMRALERAAREVEAWKTGSSTGSGR